MSKYDKNQTIETFQKLEIFEVSVGLLCSVYLATRHTGAKKNRVQVVQLSLFWVGLGFDHVIANKQIIFFFQSERTLMYTTIYLVFKFYVYLFTRQIAV